MALYTIGYLRCIVYTVRAVGEPIKYHFTVFFCMCVCVYFDLGAWQNVLQQQYFIIF